MVKGRNTNGFFKLRVPGDQGRQCTEHWKGGAAEIQNFQDVQKIPSSIQLRTDQQFYVKKPLQAGENHLRRSEFSGDLK